jgi:succinyl-diaminopimelate desuccinylase
MGLPTINVGTIAGGMNVNSVPDQAVIGVDVRSLPSMQNEEVFTPLGRMQFLQHCWIWMGFFIHPDDPLVVSTVTDLAAGAGVVPYVLTLQYLRLHLAIRLHRLRLSKSQRMDFVAR